MSSRLDSFVRDAIDEGLLTPSTPGGGTPAPAPDPEPSTDDQAPPVPIAGLRPRHTDVDFACGSKDVLDFTVYENLTSYGDLMALRELADEDELGLSAVSIAKAYLALGLNEEARMELQPVHVADATVLRRFAHLMEGRQTPDIDYFRKLADCDEENRLWLAVALLVANDPEGPAALSDSLSDFRTLPAQLREQLTFIVVPVLDRMKESLIAEKMMASFSEAEIAASPRLAFSQAVAEMRTGGQIAERKVRAFLRNPQFRTRAAGVLRHYGLAVGPEYLEDLENDFTSGLEQVGGTADVAARLDVMLQDLEDVASYDLTLQLAALPATQTPEARTKLADHFVVMLERDFDEASPIAALTAMQAMMRGEDLIADHPDRLELLASAAALAADLGLRHFADAFAAQMERENEPAGARAMLAFRLMDDATLKALLRAHPDDKAVQRFAALSAIRASDRDWLRQVEPSLRGDPQAVLAMIEFDAASEHWMVSDATYAAARALDAELYGERVAAVMALKAGTGRTGARARPGFTDVPARLSQIGASLRSNGMEGH